MCIKKSNMNSTQDVLGMLSKINISETLLNTTLKNIIDHYIILSKTHEQNCHNWMYILDMFYWYYVPFLSLCGLIGNSLSCLVFLSTYLKMRSSSYYLAALSAADFGFLASISIVWINNKLDVPIFNQNGWCQIMVYTSSVCSFLSVWLIVAFTVERFIAVQYPLHRPRVCTISRAKCIVTVLVVTSFTVHLYTLFTAGIIRTSEGDVCELQETYHDLMRVINIVDTLFTLIIPVGLIIVMNMMIAKNLFRFSKRFRRPNVVTASTSRINTQFCPTLLQSSSSNGPRRTLALQMSVIGNDGSLVGSSFTETRNHSIQHYHNAHNMATRINNANNTCQLPISRCIHMQANCGNIMSIKTQRNITKMLLLVSTVFVLLNFPSYIIRLYIFFRFSLWQVDTPNDLWCLQQVFMLLYYTNFSINFLLYNMCGITFRRCLFQLIRNFFKIITS